MSKRSRRKKRSRSSRSLSRRFPWFWLAVGGAVLLVVGVLLLRPWSGDEEPTVTPQVSGRPRLVVDRTAVDEGYVKFDVPVRTIFRLSNVGDQPLKILGEPQVWLIEGC